MDNDADTRTSNVRDSEHSLSGRNTDFQIVAEDAPVMLWLTNAEGKIVFTNSKWKKFVGAFSGETKGGDPWINALHPNDRDYCLKTFGEAFLMHRSFEMEYRLCRSDGQFRYVLDTGEPYINKEGKFSGFIGSSTDITDRKNHENQLHLSQLELTQHNREMRLINELNSYLQVCRSLGETHAIVAQYARKIFAGYSGVLYLFDEGHSLVEPVASWGGTEIFSSTVIWPRLLGAAAG